MNQPLRMVRGGLLLVVVSFLMCGRAFAQEEPEGYDPFGECSNYYYGVGVPQSYAKAFACFQKADDDIWLILMTLNGEGTPQSVKKARELLTRAENKNKPEWRDNQWLAGAMNAVEEREKGPASLKTRLNPGAQICRFAPGPTNTIEVCWANFNIAMNAANNADLELLEAKLGAPARVRLYMLQDMFGKFQEADGMWMYEQRIGGTGRGTFAAFQEILDRSDFASLIKEVVKDHGLQRRSEQELEARDQKLNSVYGDRTKADWPGVVITNRQDILNSAKDAERLWIKLQEPWKRLAEELYRGEMPPEEIDRAIATELREVRILEILCDTTCDYDFSGAPLGYSTSRLACGNYHCALGDALLNNGNGDYDGAIKEYGESLRLKPDDADSHSALGDALGRKEDWDGAIKAYREAIRLEPNNADAHQSLAEVFEKKKDWEGAIREYREVVRLGPNNADAHLKLAEAFGSLADALRKKGDFDGAVQAYQEATRLAPGQSAYHRLLGRAFEGKNDLGDAIKEYREATRLSPNDSEAHDLLGSALYDKHDLDDAGQEYRAAIRSDPKDAYAHDGLGIVLEEKGDRDAAILEYREALRLDPKYAIAHHNLALAFEHKGDSDAALKEYREALRDDPQYVDVHFDIGRVLERRNDLDGAASEYREVLRVQPENAAAYGALGWALENKKDSDGAIQEYREAIRLNPNWAEARSNLCYQLYAKGDMDAAIAECREAIRLKPDYARAHVNLAVALDKKGDWDGAVREYRETYRLEPDPGSLHYSVGQVLEHKGDKQAAFNQYRKASEADPKNSDYRAAYDRLRKELNR
jgi:tetratricopeptide (TPR) repeat protein